MTLLRKINGIPINEITYLVMKDGTTHNVNRGSMMGAINMFNDGIQRYVFVNSRDNHVTVREDRIEEVRR